MTPTVIQDRGPARFFHGRKRELDGLREVRQHALRSRGGTIFLVQGAPGAGKTALLHECGRHAERDGWRVTAIRNNALYDPAALAEQLDIPYAEREVTERGRALGGRLRVFIAGGSVQRTKRQTSQHRGPSVIQILEGAAGSSGLLLMLDEAQTLDTEADGPHKAVLMQHLTAIHNGDVGAPVVLLAAGLGISKGVFSRLGVSRFIGGGVRHLGRLSPAAERAVIRDWLVKAGGGRGDPEHLARWIDAIAAECHGWPQHIAFYSGVAAHWLDNSTGMLTKRVPAEVLAAGRKGRMEYYEGRIEGIKREDRVALANMLVTSERGTAMERSKVLAAFSEHQGPAAASATFQHALHKGVVVERRDGRFALPIPSMHDWLVQEYAERARDPSSPGHTEGVPVLRPPRGVRKPPDHDHGLDR